VRLLLDEHLSPEVAYQLLHAGVDALPLRDWLDGAYFRHPDEDVLVEAAADGRVFVSYDQRSLPGLVGSWAGAGRHHAGVILIDDRTIAQGDTGGQVRALEQMVAKHGDEDWTDRVLYLPRPIR